MQLGVSFESLSPDSGHPLLYCLIPRIAHLLGEGDNAIRLPAILFGLLAIPLIYILGNLLAGERTTPIPAVLAALSPFRIWYSQDTRMYSALVMYSAICMLVYGGTLRPESRRGTGVTLDSAYR